MNMNLKQICTYVLMNLEFRHPMIQNKPIYVRKYYIHVMVLEHIFVKKNYEAHFSMQSTTKMNTTSGATLQNNAPVQGQPYKKMHLLEDDPTKECTCSRTTLQKDAPVGG